MKFFPFGNTGQAQLAPCASAQRKEGGGGIIPQKKNSPLFFAMLKKKKPSSLSILLAYFFAKARRESAYCPLPPGSQYHFGLQQQPHLRFLPPLFSLYLLQPVSFVVVVDILVGVDVLPMYALPNGGAKHVTGSTGSQVLDELSRVGHSHYTP